MKAGAAEKEVFMDFSRRRQKTGNRVWTDLSEHPERSPIQKKVVVCRTHMGLQEGSFFRFVCTGTTGRAKKTCRQHCSQLFFAEGHFLTHRDKLPMILPSLEVRVWATAVHCNFVSCQQFAPFRQKSKILELPFYASIPHKCFTKGTGNRSLNTRRKFPVK